MNAPRPSYAACLLRAFSPAMLLVCVATILLLGAVLKLGTVMQRADTVNQHVAAVRASILAETALLRRREDTVLPMRCSIAGTTVELDCEQDRFLISIAGTVGSTEISARRLSGAAPRAFSHARVAADAATLGEMGGGYHESVAHWPQPSSEALATARHVNQMQGFHRDPEIALRYLTAGTDRPDFVWRPGDEISRPTSPGILVVPGNLWIEDDSQPLDCTLVSDLVVVVLGNLHVLRSLCISGPGRLLLVCHAEAEAIVFADQDGSGGWSAGDRLRTGPLQPGHSQAGQTFSGPVEGSGSAYFGLPGVANNIVCDAGVLVAGEMHVAGIVDVRGPLLVRYGVTRLPNPAAPDQQSALRPPGRQGWIYRRGRDRIPGFPVTGSPRPGRLEFRLR
tara:strand:+ start:30649 stop:31830 length:1182 start_codon:yes stop_codon:yes gene_type:complete